MTHWQFTGYDQDDLAGEYVDAATGEAYYHRPTERPSMTTPAPVPAQTIEPAPKRSEVRVVRDEIAVFDTGQFEHMQRVASLMSACALVPDHLRNKVADCFLVVNQAKHWNADPFAVAQCTSVIHGKLMFEGKLIAAAVASDPEIEGPLNYFYSGSGLERRVTVSGKLKGESAPRTVEGTIAQWKTGNESWTNDPDQMLAYRGARQWARRHKPDRLLGVYAPDEFDDTQMQDITPAKPQAHSQPEEDVQAAAASNRASVERGEEARPFWKKAAAKHKASEQKRLADPKVKQMEDEVREQFKASAELEKTKAEISDQQPPSNDIDIPAAYEMGVAAWHRNASRDHWPAGFAKQLKLIAAWQDGWDREEHAGEETK